MIATVRGLLARLRRWWAVEPADERIDGPGEAYLDPAYNGRYTAERRLDQLARAQEEAVSDVDGDVRWPEG